MNDAIVERTTPSPAARPEAERRRPGWPSRLGHLLEAYGAIAILVVLSTAIAILEPSFLTWRSIANILQQYAPVGIMAMAGTAVIIAGGFDFSVGGVFAFAATLSAGLAVHQSLSIAYLATLAMGLAVGLANGLIVTTTKVNPFIVTIGTGQIIRGAALIYSAGQPLIPTALGFGVIGSSFIAGVPLAGVVLITLYIIGAIILHRTVFGRALYAVGGNPEAARLCGLRVSSLLVSTYGLSGLAAALAGILFASRLGLGQADVGLGIEIDVIIAIVIGGTAIGGGSGAMWRTAVGIGIVAVMTNGFDALQIGSNAQVVAKGLILIAAVTLGELIKQRRMATVRSRVRTGPAEAVVDS